MTFIDRHCTVFRTTIRRLLCLGGVVLLAGCQTMAGGPARSIDSRLEVAAALKTAKNLESQYYDGSYDKSKWSNDDWVRLRNEIIYLRMYIHDVNYTEYELSLIQERQAVGFGVATISQGLSVAGSLVTPVQSAKILSGLAGAVGATRGFYDSEIVMAKTIQIITAQMRAQRDEIGRKIAILREKKVSEYPLPLALGDVEDYYLAGTFSSGLAKALGEADAAAAGAKGERTQAKLDPKKAAKTLGNRLAEEVRRR